MTTAVVGVEDVLNAVEHVTTLAEAVAFGKKDAYRTGQRHLKVRWFNCGFK